jgi:hypothetical protein
MGIRILLGALLTNDGVNAALHVEIVFLNLVEFTIENHLESSNGILDWYILSRDSSEYFRNMEGLR